MEKTLGIVLGAQITSHGCEINFTTEDNINIKNMVKIMFNGATRYFNITKIDAIRKDNRLFVVAKQTGYYNMLHTKDGFDPRDILELEILLVTDTEEIKKIKNESCYL